MQLKNKEKPASSNNTSQLLGMDAQATASVISGWNTIIRLQVSVWLIVLGTVIASQWKRIWEEEAEWTMKRQIKYYSQHHLSTNFCPIFAVMWTVKNICLHQHLLLCANFPPTLHCLLNDSFLLKFFPSNLNHFLHKGSNPRGWHRRLPPNNFASNICNWRKEGHKKKGTYVGLII